MDKPLKKRFENGFAFEEIYNDGMEIFFSFIVFLVCETITIHDIWMPQERLKIYDWVPHELIKMQNNFAACS